MASWEGIVSEARGWAARSALGFAVSSVEDVTRKISFRAPCGSFYVTVPENLGSDEWVGVGVIWDGPRLSITPLLSDCTELPVPRSVLRPAGSME